jgi:hypothetical protein
MQKGFTQPEAWGKWATPKKVATEGPVSLSALRSAGCLNPDLDGQFGLACFMINSTQDRPRWGMQTDASLWSPDQQRFVIRAQQLLNEYGEAMVDEGLLAK